VLPASWVANSSGPDIQPFSLSAKRTRHWVTVDNADSPVDVTQVHALPASAVLARRRQELSPHPEIPSTQPMSGEMKVIDSGWIEPAVSATVVGVGDGVALGAGVVESAGDAVADGVARGAIGPLQPASSNIATRPPSRKASMATVERASR
jgi:hypothetical protein